MKILIAGKGFLGQAVGEELEANHQVKYLSRSSGDYRKDITESFSIDESFDVLIHAVGLAPGFYDQEEYSQVHVKGTENLLNGLMSEKVIYISALGVGSVDHSYFRTKKKAEEIVAEKSDSFTIIRPSTIYGEENKLFDLIKSLSFTRVFPDLKTEMQPIMLDDLVYIVQKSVKDFDGETLKVAGPEKMTMSDLGCKIYREEGSSCLKLPYADLMAKIGLKGFGFLPAPINRENISLLDKDIEFENDATKILDLQNIL